MHSMIGTRIGFSLLLKQSSEDGIIDSSDGAFHDYKLLKREVEASSGSEACQLLIYRRYES